MERFARGVIDKKDDAPLGAGGMGGGGSYPSQPGLPLVCSLFPHGLPVLRVCLFLGVCLGRLLPIVFGPRPDQDLQPNVYLFVYFPASLGGLEVKLPAVSRSCAILRLRFL